MVETLVCGDFLIVILEDTNTDHLLTDTTLAGMHQAIFLKPMGGLAPQRYKRIGIAGAKFSFSFCIQFGQ